MSEKQTKEMNPQTDNPRSGYPNEKDCEACEGTGMQRLIGCPGMAGQCEECGGSGREKKHSSKDLELRIHHRGDRLILRDVSWKMKLARWLFGKQLNEAASRILQRAYERRLINSEQLHTLAAMAMRATMPNKY